MEANRQRPLPASDVYVPTQPFWNGARAGTLMLQYCTDTGRFQHYPRPVSLQTGSRALEWRPVSGNGTVYAFTVVRVPGPGVTDRLPLIVATIELDEGVRILGNILGCAVERVRIGERVRLAWDRLDGDAVYPAFALVAPTP